MTTDDSYTAAVAFARTAEEREDPRRLWARSDRAFFAAGACHILAFRFVERRRTDGFRVVCIRPLEGIFGTHAYATDGVHVTLNEFCRSISHRHPSEFAFDPTPRADAYIDTFPAGFPGG